MQYRGTVAASAADVVTAGGRSPVGGAVPAKDGKQGAFRCGMLTVGLDEDVSRSSPSSKLQES